MLDFKRITLFCLEKRPSKHKMTVFSKKFLGNMVSLAPLAAPMVPRAINTDKKRKERKMSAIWKELMDHEKIYSLRGIVNDLLFGLAGTPTWHSPLVFA